MEATSLITAATLLATSGGLDVMRPVLIDPGSQLCKSHTAIEGGERVLYMEASNEARDVQNETILAEALGASKDYFLKFGRFDLDHATVWQMVREMKLDPNNPYAREIGRPLDVRLTRSGDQTKVWVKAGIFRSNDKNNQFTKAADWFWDSLQCTPPVAWYPSIAGTLLPGGREERHDGRRVVKALRWHSVALTRNPVNPSVGQISTVPLEVFCKALREGSDLPAAFSAMAGFGPQSSPPDRPLDHVSGSIQDLQNRVLLSPSKADIIRQAILDAPPHCGIDQWLHTLLQANISPAEGMAFLLAVLDGGHQLSISAPESQT